MNIATTVRVYQVYIIGKLITETYLQKKMVIGHEDIYKALRQFCASCSQSARFKVVASLPVGF